LKLKHKTAVSNLEAYTKEVDDWKKDVTETFSQKMLARDAEIKELKETVELLMRKDASKEQVRKESFLNNKSSG
jgi:hypothetical protein